MELDALLAADFRRAPWHHQLREFELHADDPARALLWQMRTGKTKVVLDTACHLYRTGRIDCLVVFAPNGVHQNWLVREAPEHVWESVPYLPLGWQTRVAGAKGGRGLAKADKEAWEAEHAAWWDRYRQALRAKELPIITFNNESVTRPDIRKALAKLVAQRRVMAVWDESSDYRTPGSSRTLMMRAFARRTVVRRILDGTAVLNSPLHSFSQYELLEAHALGFAKYEDFKEQYAVYEQITRGNRKFPRVKNYINLDDLRARMAKYSSVVLRSDCDDLPAVEPHVRHIELTGEQRRIYREVMEQTKAEVARGEVASLNARTMKLLKFQQIVSGFLIDQDKRVHHIRGGNPRLEALSEEVYLAPGKVIIWCMFQEEQDQVMKRLKADGWKVAEYHGRTKDKPAELKRFVEDPEVKAFIAHPQTGGRGLELSVASTIIWYSHVMGNAIMRYQANERATKMGGGNVRLIDFVADGVDGYLLNLVERKAGTADLLAGEGMKEVLRSIEV